MKYTVTCLLFLISGTILAQKRVNYEIKGRIENPTHGEKVYLLHFVNSQRYIDSVSITDGSFTFKDKTKISYEPDANYYESAGRLFIDHSGEGIDFGVINARKPDDMVTVYLEPGVTYVHIVDSAHNAEVTPPKVTAGHYTLDSIYSAYYKKYNSSHAEAMKQQLKGKDYLDFQDKHSRIYKAEQEDDLWQFVKVHPNSPVSLYILKHHQEYYPDYNKIAPYFNALNDTLKNTDFGKAYGNMLNGLEKTRLGAQAPEFAMNNVDGKSVALSSFKGKYVLVDFWASWCGPCRQENPNIVKAYEQFKGQNFAILGVSLDKTKDAWIKAIGDDQLNWTQVSDLAFWKNAAAALYSVTAIPQNFLVDPDGKIIAKNLFGKRLTNRLKKIFGGVGDGNEKQAEDR